MAIEGVDGAGKRTLAAELAKAWRSKGSSVTSMAFPRYGVSVYADLLREALHGAHGDLASSVYGMGTLYALDRRQAHAELLRLRAEHDVVLLDRYVASNAAYQAARLGEGAEGAVVEWVRRLEIERFGLPVPDVQLLLAVPTDVAAERASGRAETEAARGRDTFETDDTLQRRCAAVYRGLAERAWLGRWYTVDGAADVDTTELTDKIDTA